VNATVGQIQRAMALIESSLFIDLPLRELARNAGASPWHFHRLFSAIVGEAPANYARKRRFGELCRRWVETDILRRPLRPEPRRRRGRHLRSGSPPNDRRLLTRIQIASKLRPRPEPDLHE
jgi:AraC-like DNA-binding protein